MDTPENRRSADPSKETTALKKVEETIEALRQCEGHLTAEGYRELRRRLGYLMDILFQVGLCLSKST